MTECSPSSTSVLHKQWAKLENEHRELAIAICAARAKKADVALMHKRQESLLREISSLVAKIRNAPATTIEDFAALLDVALEHELDLACEMAFYGPADYPIITRLFRVLTREIPGFEFNSLRRWLSVPGQFEQLIGRATHLETEEDDGPPDEAKEIARSKPRRGGVIGRRYLKPEEAWSSAGGVLATGVADALINEPAVRDTKRGYKPDGDTAE